MRVVFDTNIFISAFLIPRSKGEQAFLFAQQKRVSLYTSIAILTETAQKLRGKFDQAEGDIKAVLQLISRVSTVLNPSPSLSVLEDDPDNRILECALAAQADLIVTGDRHLLKLKKFQDIPVLRLADFLRLFPEQQ